MTERTTSRRELLKKAAYAAPVIASLQAAPAFARNGSDEPSNGPKCNNGLGQRIDVCQPPGLQDKEHLWNDKPGSIPGQPNNRGG